MKRLIVALPAACVLPAAALLTLGSAPPADQVATPKELVSSYNSLADAILAVKATEANLVRSILATAYAHAQADLGRARRALAAGRKDGAVEAIEALAAHVAQLGAEGDNAVAGIRKRLLEGGHHHNAAGEAQGVFDPGFVIVTKAAKKAFLDASRAIGRLASTANADALAAEWAKVEATWASLQKD